MSLPKHIAGLTARDVDVLAFIQRHPACNITEVSDMLMLDYTLTCVAIARLESRKKIITIWDRSSKGRSRRCFPLVETQDALAALKAMNKYYPYR